MPVEVLNVHKSEGCDYSRKTKCLDAPISLVFPLLMLKLKFLRKTDHILSKWHHVSFALNLTEFVSHIGSTKISVRGFHIIHLLQELQSRGDPGPRGPPWIRTCHASIKI